MADGVATFFGLGSAGEGALLTIFGLLKIAVGALGLFGFGERLPPWLSRLIPSDESPPGRTLEWCLIAFGFLSVLRGLALIGVLFGSAAILAWDATLLVCLGFFMVGFFGWFASKNTNNSGRYELLGVAGGMGILADVAVRRGHLPLAVGLFVAGVGIAADGMRRLKRGAEKEPIALDLTSLLALTALNAF